mgnify:CR=1 FL=1
MLDQLLQNPLVAVGFIILVIYMAGVYFMHKEKASVRRMQGRHRFQPDWNRRTTGGTRRRRISHRGGEFKPQWNRTSGRPGPEEAAARPAGAEPRETESRPEPPGDEPRGTGS